MDRALAALAATQHGVVTREQALALGITRHGIAHRLATGQVHPLHRGVFAVGHLGLSVHGIRLAAVLACGDRAFLSHRSAAVLHGLLPEDGGLLHVTVPMRRRPPAGVLVHRSQSAEAVRRDGERDGVRAVAEARLLHLVTDAELLRIAPTGLGRACCDDYSTTKRR